MKQVHVLHVLNSGHGGSALSTFELIEGLRDRGVKSSLICFNNVQPERARKIAELVEGRVLFIPLYWTNKRIRAKWWKRPFIEIFSLWRTWAGYRYQSTISDLIRENRINVVHTSTILNREGAIAARLNGLPHLWHVRELIGPDKHFRFWNYSRWASYVLTNAEYLIANSTATRQCLGRYMPSKKILTIPNGIKVEEFLIRQHDNSSLRKVVGMVGNVTSRLKNHEFFIRTAGLLKGRGDIEFRIYGALPCETDAYYRRLRNLVSDTGLDGLLNFVDFKDPVQIFGEIDVMFHPTSFESFGRIFVEAMAGGVPIVAVNEGGALEMVEDGVNGYLIPPEDAQSASLRISSLVDSAALRHTMGTRGRELAFQRYSLSRLSDDVFAVYKEVLK